MQGNQKSSNYERVVWPEGVYPCTLVKAFAMRGKPTKFSKEGAIKIGFIWQFKDAEGNEFELGDFVNLPKGFAYNEKSNFWKRLGEIAGVAITNDNVSQVNVDFDFIESYDELVESCDSKDDKGNPEKPKVTGLQVNGQELLNCTRQLVVKVWNGEDGAEGNEITSILSAETTKAGPKKAAPKQEASKAEPKAAPVQEPVLAATPTPRRQPTSTEPLQQAAGSDY